MDLKQMIHRRLKKDSMEFVRQKTNLEQYADGFVIVFFISLVTSLISIYGTANFLIIFSQTFADTLVGQVFAWVLAIALELLTVYTLVALTVALIERSTPRTAFWVVFLVIFYGMNFYSSTVGFENKAGEKVDVTARIDAQFSRDSAYVHTRYPSLIDSLSRANAALGSKNTVFNHDQIKANTGQIAYYREKYDRETQRINADRETQRAENTVKVSSTEGKNFRYIMVNQGIQVVTYILMSLFKVAVGRENQTVEERMKARLKPVLEGLDEKVMDRTITNIVNKADFVTSHMLSPRDNGKPLETAKQEGNQMPQKSGIANNNVQQYTEPPKKVQAPRLVLKRKPGMP